MTNTLILASKSASRRAMLDAAGVAYTSIPADIDERAIEASLTGAAPADVAEALAVAKAAAVAALHPQALVLGSDSLVVCNGRRFDKPRSICGSSRGK
jgi:septum formation protein